MSLIWRSGLKRPLSASTTSWNESMPSQVTWIVFAWPGVQVHGEISRPANSKLFSRGPSTCSLYLRGWLWISDTYALHNATMHSLLCQQWYTKSQPCWSLGGCLADLPTTTCVLISSGQVRGETRHNDTKSTKTLQFTRPPDTTGSIICWPLYIHLVGSSCERESRIQSLGHLAARALYLKRLLWNNFPLRRRPNEPWRVRVSIFFN